MVDRAEMLLKAVATHYLAIATANLAQSMKCAVAFERASDKRIKEEQAQHAAYHQFLALQADEIAREVQIDSDEMHRFMHLFFATGKQFNPDNFEDAPL